MSRVAGVARGVAIVIAFLLAPAAIQGAAANATWRWLPVVASLCVLLVLVVGWRVRKE